VQDGLVSHLREGAVGTRYLGDRVHAIRIHDHGNVTPAAIKYSPNLNGSAPARNAQWIAKPTVDEEEAPPIRERRRPGIPDGGAPRHDARASHARLGGPRPPR
jgi:hypothetical protein